MMLGFLPFLYGLFTSTETDRALVEIQHTLSYLAIPLSVILLPRLEKQQRVNLFGLFIIIIVLSTIPVLGNYFLNFEVITQSLGEGKAIPTPMDHVRYSIFIAVTCVFSAILFSRGENFFGKVNKYIFLALSIYLFIVVHLFAVRSGIALTYIGLGLSGTFLLFKTKKYGLIVLLFVVIALSPVLAYFAIPSFQNKVKYTRYDLSLLRAGQGANYSDSERLRSIKIGIDIWKDYKVLGIGSGDLKREVGNRYFETYTKGGRAFLPHNQFVKFLAASGVLGLLCFLISVYFPFFWSRNFADPYILAFIGIFTVSFMVEATLERSYMLVFYLLLGSLLYKKSAD
jgi:O-antigen ligase